MTEEQHEATVTYRTDDDCIWLTCICGWKQVVDYYPTLAQVNEAWDEHVKVTVRNGN